MKLASVLYLGLHPETPTYIQGAVTLSGIGKLDFFEEPGLNPANRLFRHIYRMAERRNTGFLAYIAWPIARPFLTGVFRRYRPHIDVLISSRAHVVSADNPDDLLAYIYGQKIDLVVINSWSLLPHEVIVAPKFGTINIHPSRLPEYRGSLPTLWALKNGDTSSALTFMLLDAAVDTGEILSQYEFPIETGDTSLDLERKTDSLIRLHLREDTERYLQGALKPRAQVGDGSSTGKYQAYRKILWTKEKAKDVRNKVLLYPYLEWGQGCYWSMHGDTVPVYGMDLAVRPLKPGQFIIESRQLYIGTLEGSVCIRLFVDIPKKESARLLHNLSGFFS